MASQRDTLRMRRVSTTFAETDCLHSFLPKGLWLRGGNVGILSLSCVSSCICAFVLCLFCSLVCSLFCVCVHSLWYLYLDKYIP